MDVDPGLFRAALDTMLDCVSILTSVRDASGRVVDFRIEYQNAAACTNNHVAPGQQLGKLLCEEMPAHRTTGLFDEYVRVVETGEPLLKRAVFYVDDFAGRRMARYNDIRATRVHDGFLVAWRDVTGEEELRRARELVDALAKTWPASIYVKDLEGRYLMANPHVRAMLGDVIGKTDADLQPPEVAKLYRESDLAALRSQEPIESDQRAGDRTFLTTKFALRDRSGEPYAVCGVSQDITDRKRVEQRFLEAFARAPMPIAISRLEDGRVIEINDAWLDIIGLPREQVLGRTIVELGLWGPEQRAELADLMRRDGELRDAEVTMQTRRRGERRMLISAQRIEVDGKPCVLGMVRDVTDEHAAREALRHSEESARARAEELRALLDATPAAIWISQDQACREVIGSRAAHELLRVAEGGNLSKTGPEPESLAHVKVFDTAGVEIPDTELPLQRAARGVEVGGFEEELRFADGTSTWLFGNARPLSSADGKPRGAIAAFVDITRIKSAEQALRENDRRKDEFLAMLSHELRNPLAPIRNAVELLQRGAHGRELVEVIDRQTAHLKRLVDDLLDVARVTQGKIVLQKERVSLLSLVAQAAETSRPLMEAKEHKLTVSLPPEHLEVEGDAARLAQVLSNLLNNAAKYTDAGGNVALRAERRGGEVAISVSDDGMGIAAEDLPRVFDLFAQAQRSIDRAQGGLGVGLTLVRKLVEMHGGRVTAQSAGPGHGSELTVVLPVAPPLAATRAPLRPAPARAQRGRRVLVVDDNVDSAETVALLLQTDGHETRLAHDGAGALQEARSFTPELVLLDLGLPGMSGYEVARLLREDPAMASVTLVALTGYGREEDQRRSREAGFQHHLTKPIEYDELSALIRDG